jgi:SulP family sulfate permease
MSFVPKLATTMRAYTRQQFTADATAGVIVGIVALLGGSRVQIAGPTGAFVVIIYGIVQQYGVAGLSVATVMAGVILIALGLARLGGAIKFIPHPVVTGFTSGIALIIFTGQLRDYLGLAVTKMPAGFLPQVERIAEVLPTSNGWAPLVATVSMLTVVYWPRVTTQVPSPFVAILWTTAAVQLLHLRMETTGSRFGVIDASFPVPQLPALSLERVRGLVGPAFAIAMLGGIESLLSAVVADGMIGG